jgi:UDP:flavonoid glycosyltransferase YjiC (YdhE family)
MKARHLLFISGSGGLGHVTRDLAMARALRRAVPGVEISWLAASPASRVLEEAGEALLPEAGNWADETAVGVELAGRDSARGRLFRFDVLTWFLSSKPQHRQNVEVFRRVTAAHCFDLIIGDEAYEIVRALRAREVRTPAPFVMIYDFIGVDPMTRNPLENIGAYLINRSWAYGYRRAPDVPITVCFIGETEDIPDRSFGPGLPNRRRWAQERCHILGYVLPFDLTACREKPQMRRKLGYGEEPLVVCAVGGWGVGKELLDLCLESFPLVREGIPNLRMVIVGGPRIQVRPPGDISGLEVHGYVPDLYEHFAASDLVVTQGGGTSTLELTALRRPFLYFPLDGHFEQQLHVARRLERHGAGVRMEFSATSARDLADTIVSHIGRKATWRDIPVQGAERLAGVAASLLDQRSTG